jgi:hypothetical protein
MAVMLFIMGNEGNLKSERVAMGWACSLNIVCASYLTEENIRGRD